MAAAHLLSPGERLWHAGGFAAGVRVDGRAPGELRRVYAAAGVLPAAAGSAEVRLGGTHGIVGVKVRVGMGQWAAGGGADSDRAAAADPLALLLSS